MGHEDQSPERPPERSADPRQFRGTGGATTRSVPPSSDGLSAGELGGLGLQMAVAILVFLYAGQWLDRKLGTAPWFLLIGVFVGAGGSFYSMYRKLMAAQAREERAAAEAKERAKRGETR